MRINKADVFALRAKAPPAKDEAEELERVANALDEMATHLSYACPDSFVTRTCLEAREALKDRANELRSRISWMAAGQLIKRRLKIMKQPRKKTKRR